MEANMTELWQIVESLQLELSLVRANLTASLTAASVVADDLATFGTDMDMLWLMLGSILVICESLGTVPIVANSAARGVDFAAS